MKPNLVLLFILLSGTVAADVDYSRCQIGIGSTAFIDNDGKVHAPFGSTLKDKKTEGKVETYTFSIPNYSDPKAKPIDHKMVVERNDLGHVVKVNAGDNPSPVAVKAFKESMTKFMISSTSTPSQTMGGYRPFDQRELEFTVVEDTASSKTVRSVPLSQLSEAQAKQLGINNLEELKRLKKQWRKDKKTLARLEKGFTQMMDTAPVQMPVGNLAEFEIKDGVCQLSKVTQRAYNTKTKEIVNTQTHSRALCEGSLKVQKKYRSELDKCQDLQSKVMNEMYQAGGGMGAYGGMGSYGGGMAVGSMGGFGANLGVGGFNPYMGGFYGGSDICQMYFGDVSPFGFGSSSLDSDKKNSGSDQ